MNERRINRNKPKTMGKWGGGNTHWFFPYSPLLLIQRHGPHTVTTTLHTHPRNISNNNNNPQYSPFYTNFFHPLSHIRRPHNQSKAEAARGCHFVSLKVEIIGDTDHYCCCCLASPHLASPCTHAIDMWQRRTKTTGYILHHRENSLWMSDVCSSF